MGWAKRFYRLSRGRSGRSFLVINASGITVVQFADGMYNAFRWSNFNSFAKVFTDLAGNGGFWPVEAAAKRMRIPADDNHVAFVQSMSGAIKSKILQADTDAHWEDVVSRVVSTIRSLQYASLIQNRTVTVQHFMLFVFFKSAAERTVPVSFVKLAHMVARLCRQVEYLQLMYASSREADLEEFRGAVTEDQFQGALGAFPWSENGGLTGLPLWAFYIERFNFYNEGFQVGFRAVQVPATGGCGYLTLIVLYLLATRLWPNNWYHSVLGISPELLDLPDDCDLSVCSDTVFCFSRLQCLSVLRVIAATGAVSHLNPSSMSDHSFSNQLDYFIRKLEHWGGAEDVVLWSAVGDEWMLDVTDISMFIARCFSVRVRMWRLCSAQPPDRSGPSEVIEYPNGIDLEPNLDDAEVCAHFAPVFMHGTNSGHIVPAVRIIA